MAKVHNNLQSLSKAVESEVNVLNNKIIADEMRRLEARASRLLHDINTMWLGYESSYKPSQYIRTGKTKSGFSLSRPIIEKDPITGGTYLTVYLILDDSAMWHNSIFGSNGTKGHSFMLISEGWRWNQASINSYGNRYRLSEFEGVGIVDALLSSYSTSEFDFKFYFEGQEYGGKKDRARFSFTR